MNYVKVENVLPEHLIIEIQKYIQGKYVYIPCIPQEKKKWGESSGNREYIKKRNEEIRQRYKAGYSVKNLTEEFFLSPDSIKKIIYGNR